jgi:hypothetical protein
VPALPTLAVAPLAGLALLGSTDQSYQGQQGTVQAAVAADARSLSTLVVDGLLRCESGALDVRTFTATDVNVARRGTFAHKAAFDQPATSADGRAVTARFTTRLAGEFTSPRKLRGTLVAKVAYEVDGAVYATCRSGRIEFSGSAPRAAAAP